MVAEHFAVVGREDDQGFVIFAGGFEMIDDAANLGIDFGDEAEINGAHGITVLLRQSVEIERRVEIARQRHLLHPFGKIRMGCGFHLAGGEAHGRGDIFDIDGRIVGSGRDQGRMGAEEDGVDQPVFAAAQAEKIEHLVGDVGGVAVFRRVAGGGAGEAHRVGRNLRGEVDVAVGFGDSVALAGKLREPAGEAALIERGFEPEAGENAFIGAQAWIVGGHVARIGGAVGIAEEHGIAAGAAGFKREIGVAFVERRAVANRAVDEGVEAGEQRRPRRAAGGGGGEMVAEGDAVSREAVEIGGDGGGVAEEAERIAAPLIRRDEQYLATGHIPFPLVGGQMTSTGVPSTSMRGVMPRPGASDAVMRPFLRCGAPSAIVTVP